MLPNGSELTAQAAAPRPNTNVSAVLQGNDKIATTSLGIRHNF
jgi:hypothetical protein